MNTQTMTSRGVSPLGDRALLVTAPEGGSVVDLANALRFTLGDLAVSVVPGAQTVVVHLSPDADQGQAMVAAGDAAANPPVSAAATGREVVLPVRYDGPDLSDVATLLGMSADEVVARHTAGVYEVAFLGFAPGFPYLTGLDPVLTVPRLDSPRTRVPAGSVGLAAGSTCVYPGVSPGGWRLIGTTDTILFDPSATSPALLAPGDTVRFEAVA